MSSEILDYVLITTGDDYKTSLTGHARLRVMRNLNDVLNWTSLDLSWGPDEKGVIVAKAYAQGTDIFDSEVQLVNDMGFLAVAIPKLGTTVVALDNVRLKGVGPSDKSVTKVISANKLSGYTKTSFAISELPPELVSGLLPGMIIPWASELVPDGFLEYNGGQIDVTAYPALAKLYPEATLPDLRGCFLRIADIARAALNVQDQMVGPLKFVGKVLPPHTHELYVFRDAYQRPKSCLRWGNAERSGVNGSGTAVDPISGGVTMGTIEGTGEVTRPRNIGVRYITLAG